MPRFLFLTVTDWAMRRTVGRGENGTRWKFTSKLDDVDFADSGKNINNGGRQIGLTINMEKIKAMRINAKNQQSIMIAGLRIEEGSVFSYLEATVCRALNRR